MHAKSRCSGPGFVFAGVPPLQRESHSIEVSSPCCQLTRPTVEPLPNSKGKFHGCLPAQFRESGHAAYVVERRPRYDFHILASRRKDAQQTTVKVDDLKQSLLSLLLDTNKGFPGGKHDYDPEEIETAVKELEARNPTGRPAFSSRIDGDWSLLYTTSAAMIKNKGVTGFGSGFCVDLLDVRQTFNSGEKTMSISEDLRIWKGPVITNTIEGNYEAQSDSQIRIIYENAVWAGRLKTIARSAGLLEMTYVDRSLRIARGTGGNLFVFKKVDSR